MSYDTSASLDFSPLNSAGLLESFFKDFYYELLRCKELALRTVALDDQLNLQEEKVKDGEESSVDEKSSDEYLQEGKVEEATNKNQHPLEAMKRPPVPVHAVKSLEEIQNSLKKIWIAQTNKVVHLLDQTDSLQFKDAQYAMVALADEVFLNLSWHGRTLWAQQLLESQIFQSQSSGATLFQKIDELLSKYDPARQSLATVYFHVLALGFKGNYTESEHQSLLKNYEARLYAFIYGKNPALNDYGLDKLIPDCYASTVQSEAQPGLPDVRFWTSVILGILLFLFLISYVIWYDTASELHKSLRMIFDQFQVYLNTS